MTLDKFYKSKEWETFRARLMMERTTDEGLICEFCHQPILKPYDCIAHHKVRLDPVNVNDYTVSLNPDNIELIHFKCHNKLHQRYNGFEQRVYLVYGSPCAGKHTFVESVANDDDLIVDIDSIWECVCKADRFHKPNRLKANVFKLRDELIDQVKTRTGMWRNAYIIGTYPLRTERDRLCDLLRAIPVFIEAKKEDCLARAKTEVWKDYIEDWFDSYT